MKRDFSANARQELLSLVAQVENEKWCDFTDWVGDRWYDFEAWIGKLDVKDYIDDINSYHKKVIDKNNTTASQINKIFEDVNEVSNCYRGRFGALLSDLQGLKNLLDSFSDTVDPANGLFNSEYIGSGLKGKVNSYLDSSQVLLSISEDGLSQETVQDMDQEKLKSILEQYGTSVIDNIPDLEIGDEIELPIGPGVTFYYKVDGNVKDTSDVNIKSTIEEQRLKLKEFGYTADYGGVEIGADFDADGKISVSGKEPQGGKVSISGDGLDYSYENKIGNNTYTYSYGMELVPPALTMEESVKTDLGNGSVTSTIGIKFEDNSSWKPLPAPVPVESPYTCQIPDFDVNWEAVGTVAVIGVVVVAAGVLIVSTGGAAAPVLVLV